MGKSVTILLLSVLLCRADIVLGIRTVSYQGQTSVAVHVVNGEPGAHYQIQVRYPDGTWGGEWSDEGQTQGDGEVYLNNRRSPVGFYRAFKIVPAPSTLNYSLENS